MKTRYLVIPLILLAAALAWLRIHERSAQAYVEVPYTLGRLVLEATHIVHMRIEKVDKEKNLIIYRKVKDIKGTHPTDIIRHNIGKAGFHPREWQITMQWAEVGKTAIFLHNGGASETCIDNYWYQAYPGGDWWNMSHSEPYLLRSFAGKPDKLATAIAAIVAGQEVVVPCMLDGDKNAMQLRTQRIQRMKASLKLQDYNPKRDFVGWGGNDEFRRIAGMPGFAQASDLPRLDPAATGIAAADVDGDGRADLCLYGPGKVLLMKAGDNSLDEFSLPVAGGAHSADWADVNGDGKPDLLLATSSGPKLLINATFGTSIAFRDDSAQLPVAAYPQASAAAFIDANGDKKPDILLATAFDGLRLLSFKSILPPVVTATPRGAASVPPSTAIYEETTAAAGLGPQGVAGKAKITGLMAGDFNGDGKMDLLASAASGPILLISAQPGFTEQADSGLKVQGLAGRPAAGDVDGDGKLDLLLPTATGVKLFRNLGAGKFADATAQAGDLAKPVGPVGGVLMVDLSGKGKPDILLGCLRGANRFYRNDGKGGFTDASAELGLSQRIYNTRALAAADLNKDGSPDLLLANQGQDSIAFLSAAKATAPPATPTPNPSPIPGSTSRDR